MDNRIEKHIELKAPQSRVWKALTDYQQFGEWFRVKMEGPFIAGQRVKGKNLWPGYEHLLMDITIQSIEPETLFSYTWHPFALDVTKDYSHETPTLVSFTLTPTPTGTLLTLTETGFENLPPERLAEAFRANTSGWQLQLTSIETYVTQNS